MLASGTGILSGADKFRSVNNEFAIDGAFDVAQEMFNTQLASLSLSGIPHARRTA